jgi:PAS domain S-box-containing protein
LIAPAACGWCMPQHRRPGIRRSTRRALDRATTSGTVTQSLGTAFTAVASLIACDMPDRADVRDAVDELRLLNAAVLQSTEAMLVTDADLELPGPRIVFANPAFCRMTGYSLEELLDRTPRILQGPRTDREVLCRLKDELQHGGTFSGEAVNYRKDGSEYDLEWRVARAGRPRRHHPLRCRTA